MRSFLVPLALLVGSFACSRASQAPSPEPVAPASRSEVVIPSGALKLRGWVFRPGGAGPFPAVVYNHGSEKDPSLDTFRDLGSWFQEHGYVVVLPFRRGSGGSPGAYWEDGLPPKTSPDYGIAVVDALETENADVSSAIAWARELPYVDPARVSVAGCSFGGIHTLLAAEKPQGLHAAVDFAGASMSWSSSLVLQRRLTTAVEHAQTPVFFLQAENDFNTAPSTTLAQAMEAAHEPHRVHIFPPHGTTHQEGHAGFCTKGMNEWGDEVLAFLAKPG